MKRWWLWMLLVALLAAGASALVTHSAQVCPEIEERIDGVEVTVLTNCQELTGTRNCWVLGHDLGTARGLP